MSAHTLGPWTATEGEQEIMGVRKDGAECIAEACRLWEGHTLIFNDEAKANALLIAAAPELLAALRDVIGWVPGPSCFHTSEPRLAVERALAAIAKAEGRAA